MALIVPQAALVRIIWTLGGQPFAVNVLGCRKTGATVIDQALANTVGASIKASFTSSGLAGGAVSTTVGLANVGVRDISSAANVEFIDGGASVPGSVGDDVLPPQVAYCVTLRTARAGKSYRGRVYLPGFTKGQSTTGGTVTAAARDFAAAFLNDIRTDLPATGLSLAVVSRKNLTTELVTLAQGRDLVWDTIRGRATAGI